MTAMRSGKERTETDLVDRLRRLAIKGVSAIAGLAFLCNLGTLAVPIFNMQIFNRVLPTRNLDTIIELAGGLTICLAAWAMLEMLRSAAQEVLAARFVARLSLPLIQATAFARRPDLAAAEALADLETLRSFLCSRACLAPFDIAWAPIFLLALLLMHWGLAALALLCMTILVGMSFLGHTISRRRQWTDALAAWQRLRLAFAQPSPRRYLEPLPAPTPRLIVENLAFLPPGADRPLLRGITFAVEPGEAVAVVGPSSAGKSTLLRLIVGIAPPTAGGVFLDGTSTFLWEREDFARHVGFVPQRPSLLEESVLDNIGRMQNPDFARVVAAAKRAGVHRAIAGLPSGYSTKLIGNLLSGGQRQRLALARALFSQPKLLVLDEPTAFLDGYGEADFLALLAELKRDGVTVLLATHRPSLLSSVDKVLVLRAGVVAQFGPAAEIGAQLRKRPFRLVSNDANRVAVS